MDSFLRYYAVLNNLQKRSSIKTDERLNEEPEEDEDLVDDDERPCTFIYTWLFNIKSQQRLINKNIIQASSGHNESSVYKTILSQSSFNRDEKVLICIIIDDDYFL